MSTREPLYAQSTVVDGDVYVRVNKAHSTGDRVYVSTSMQNQSNRTIVVQRDELSLRLADGTTVPQASGRRARKPVVIKPGQSKNVKVDFRAPPGTDVSAAHLVLGGVRVRGEKSPRTLGEIALASDHAMLPISRALASAAERGDAEAVGPDASDAELSEDAGADEAAEDDVEGEGEGEGEEPAMDPQEPAAEGWQIGGS